MPAVYEKLDVLKSTISAFDSLAVAFSGGVDSSFLLQVAHELLGNRILAVTVRSLFFPHRELQEAKDFCRARSIRQLELDVDELAIPGVAQNPKDRCYLCKRALFGRIIALAREEGIACVCEGSNMDDMGDYRPGLRAVAELGVKSPLRDAGLFKSEIREFSRR